MLDLHGKRKTLETFTPLYVNISDMQGDGQPLIEFLYSGRITDTMTANNNMFW